MKQSCKNNIKILKWKKVGCSSIKIIHGYMSLQISSVHVTAVEWGCGEVKCPFCIENCDFEQYVQRRSSCLKKGEDGNMFFNPEHAYYYQVQQQLFTVDRI